MAKKLDILFSEADSFFADKENFTNENILRAYTWVKSFHWNGAMKFLLRAK